MTGPARYVFAVARGLRSADLRNTRGFRDAPLRVIDHAGLSAVVCDVGLEEFGEEPLTRNLEDLVWLERVARTHNDVVWAVAAQATCAPLRLVTICSDDDSVRSRVDALRVDLDRVLDRVEGRQEWSLKLLAHREASSEPATAGGVPGSGAEYLRRKKELAQRRRELDDGATAAASQLHEVAHQHAVASRRLPPQDPRLTGRTEPMVLNAAYLVDAAQGEAFAATVRAEAARLPEVTMELDGPWPPYSFAVLG